MEYTLLAGIPILWGWHRSMVEPLFLRQTTFTWGRNLVSITITWGVNIRNSSWFSYSEGEVATGRGVSQKGSWETGVSYRKDWKEKGEDIVPGVLPPSHHLFLKTEASGWCDSLCVVIYLPEHSPFLVFPIFFFPLFLLLSCVSGGHPNSYLRSSMVDP